MTNEERDKAIRILQWLHNNNFLFASTEEDVKYATKLGIQALEQEPNWIPVSERLPKENGRYLCTVGTDYRNPREMYYEPKGKNNRTWASLDRAYVEDCFVIAWMPLPEPYKGEQPKIIKCPNCGNVQFADKEWCPDCGAKMVKPQKTKQPEISSYYGLKSYVRESENKE